MSNVVNPNMARPGNKSALRHGIDALRKKGFERVLQMPVEGLGPKGRGLTAPVQRMREALQETVLQHKEEVNMVDALHITTACRSELISRLALRWLRLNELGSDLSAADKVNFAKLAMNASRMRDRAVKDLEIPKTKRKTIEDVLYHNAESEEIEEEED